MSKSLFKLDKELSIVELETRQELTVTIQVEAGKGDDPNCGGPNCGGGNDFPGTTVPRCSR